MTVDWRITRGGDPVKDISFNSLMNRCDIYYMFYCYNTAAVIGLPGYNKMQEARIIWVNKIYIIFVIKIQCCLRGM